MSRLDGATVEVIGSYLVSAAEEMRRTLIRTAFNPVIYEVLDFGISIYDRELDLIAEAPGLAFFLGANDYAIRKGVAYVGEANLDPGDIVLMNYPYWNAAHAMDVTAVRSGLRAGRHASVRVHLHSRALDGSRRQGSGLRPRFDRHAPGRAHLPRHEGLQARPGGPRDSGAAFASTRACHNS